jgi:DNA-binding IclR family transcriptional regulator
VVCLAVPVTAGDVGTVAALSVSATPAVASTQTGRITRALVDAAARMSRSLDQA